MKENELKRLFLEEKGIDLTDYDISGKFPRRKNGKWGLIERGLAFKWYSEWLESRLIESHTETNELD